MKNRKLKNSELGRIDAQSFKGSEKNATHNYFGQHTQSKQYWFCF